MNNLYPLIICLLLVSVAYSQDNNKKYYHNAYRNTVMAHSGLNIRKKANLKSEVLGKIPFGEKVQILHKDHYGYQKLNTVKTQMQTFVVDGFWLKVKYKNTTGFVLSTFLHQPYRFDYLIEYNDYVLLQPGGGCSDNIHNISSYNWFGLYEDEVGTSLKPISFEYYNVVDAMTFMKIVVKEDKDLRYIIGSKKQLKPFIKKKKKAYADVFESNIYNNECDTTYILNDNLIAEYEVENRESNYGLLTYYIKSDQKYYKLTPSGDVHKYTNVIHFVGDIDSDGVDDYICSIGEKPQHTFLFLSSASQSGQIVRDVAVFHATYCC